MPGALIDFVITWAETQRENEIDSRSFEGFHVQLDYKLTNGNINQTQLTLV